MTAATVWQAGLLGFFNDLLYTMKFFQDVRANEPLHTSHPHEHSAAKGIK
jgi:hypothetical protein